MSSKATFLQDLERAKKIFVYVKLNHYTEVHYEPPIHQIKAAIYRKFKESGSWNEPGARLNYAWDESLLAMTIG